jgi:hypothetical protein
MYTRISIPLHPNKQQAAQLLPGAKQQFPTTTVAVGRTWIHDASTEDVEEETCLGFP